MLPAEAEQLVWPAAEHESSPLRPDERRTDRAGGAEQRGDAPAPAASQRSSHVRGCRSPRGHRHLARAALPLRRAGGGGGLREGGSRLGGRRRQRGAALRRRGLRAHRPRRRLRAAAVEGGGRGVAAAARAHRRARPELPVPGVAAPRAPPPAAGRPCRLRHARGLAASSGGRRGTVHGNHDRSRRCVVPRRRCRHPPKP
mmetsp:Transcript_23454/g.65699  ORF Transcript_23454/g.65699 Transcript_23454/m.65699 type:complete len:200 (-) Transcript_23454:68-667(-)